MKSRLVTCGLLGLALALTWQTSAAHGPFKLPAGGLPPCEPGYQYVEEVTYKEVKRAICKSVPDVQKKWVYTWIDDPFCILDHHHGCPDCAGPHCRKQLVKKQVEVPCPHTKCVTEFVVELVPCVVHRKVPIGTVTPLPPVEVQVIPAPQEPKIMPPPVK